MIPLREYVERLFIEQDARTSLRFDNVTSRFDQTDKALKIAAELNARELEHLNNLRQEFERQKGVLVSQELFDSTIQGIETARELAAGAIEARMRLLERDRERAAGTGAGASQAVTWVLSGLAGMGTLAALVFGIIAAR